MDPESENELSGMIAGAEGPLRIVGGGTQGVGGTVEGDVLSTAGLSGVVEYEPGALTLVVKAGTPVAEIEKVLAAEGQRLAFEPMDYRGLMGTKGAPTIGGVVAGNVSGPRRIAVGACRDFLLGVRFVDGMGRVLKNGGRVMKNVTGYDLVKLMAGSRGTLGVLSEVSFKVLPEPPARAVLLIEGLSDAEGVEALTRALTSPFEVSGAAHVPKGVDGAPVTMIRIEGFSDSVAYRADQLKALLAGFGAAQVETDAEQTAAGWRWVRDVEAFHGSDGDVWRYSVAPGDGPVLGEVLRGMGAKELLYDWGGGLVWVLTPEGADMRPAGMKGHATLIRASANTKARVAVFHPDPAPIQKISQGLRDKFDPRGILNPGLMS
ncbi:FAD-binding protein [Alisedimentitalea sp. MJ-SS2]|uniref:FAD-binding protein n=1 Tax=Aliisedimentitalea sp. MJ-SS2 TaxID=3049795 RepID=UPI00290B2A44|nr:FAD-binding protein [Alisedimentitalea sp. MJ-SS2]MDU8929299.1 FAD-binding protein [Alisedimentitalea sp. MJ-SS2]